MQKEPSNHYTSVGGWCQVAAWSTDNGFKWYMLKQRMRRGIFVLKCYKFVFYGRGTSHSRGRQNEKAPKTCPVKQCVSSVLGAPNGRRNTSSHLVSSFLTYQTVPESLLKIKERKMTRRFLRCFPA
ncbi:unnamed protein product [Malus baccata var. baccata]